MDWDSAYRQEGGVSEGPPPWRVGGGADIRPQYDFIVCGSGSSGSAVARRLAENPDVSVLLLEAGGDDDVPEVMRAEQWPLNLGSERDWNFTAQPNPHLNGRSIPYAMGKVLGGGSSINVMAWARGHKNDWDFFAAEAGDVIIGERAAEILQAEHTL
jgi:choline dehydrogenase